MLNVPSDPTSTDPSDVGVECSSRSTLLPGAKPLPVIGSDIPGATTLLGTPIAAILLVGGVGVDPPSTGGGVGAGVGEPPLDGGVVGAGAEAPPLDDGVGACVVEAALDGWVEAVVDDPSLGDEVIAVVLGILVDPARVQIGCRAFARCV